MHWADVVAEKLLKERTEHVISSGITPSGPIHLGSMREILTADAIVRAINDKGGKAKLIYIADNADPLRKVYPFLDEERYTDYVGRPLAEIPAPEGEGSYDQFFLKPFFKALKTVGVYPTVVNNYNYYSKGKYEQCTKMIVEKKEIVRKILEDVSGRQLPKNWFPWTFKDNDGKLCSGNIIKVEWPFVVFTNMKGEEVKNNMAKGEGKLPWRLDWPSKWKTLDVTFEAFGKDHATKGGSYDTGEKIIQSILNGNTPHHIVYEWIHLKGKGAMHSSTGLAISAKDMLKMAPPEVIRWLIMQPQPNRHIDFDPGLGLLNSVDKYDKIEQKYYEKELEENSSRAYELSQIKNSYKKQPQNLPYKHLVTLSQSKSSLKEIIETLIKTKEITNINDYDRKRLEKRIKSIKIWLEKYAPESLKFKIQDEPPIIDFSMKDKGKIKAIKRKMENISWTAEKIHESFYEIQDEQNIPAKELFKIMYNIILNKEKGPRLGFFLATMEKDFVIKRLEHY